MNIHAPVTPSEKGPSIAKHAEHIEVSVWTAAFERRAPLPFADLPTFKVRHAYRDLNTYEGYIGGHEVLDRLIHVCEELSFPKRRSGADSPLNVANYETFYRFLDGGLLIYAGNYHSHEIPVGAYVLGFGALRFALERLGLKTPRRFRDE